jgi:hypothetical protein
MTEENFIVYAPKKCEFRLGDVVQIVSNRPIVTYGEFKYTYGVVIGHSDIYPFHDLIGLKYQERRVFPTECIATYNGSNEQINKIRFNIYEQATNENINYHIPDLSNQISSILSPFAGSLSQEQRIC